MRTKNISHVAVTITTLLLGFAVTIPLTAEATQRSPVVHRAPVLTVPQRPKPVSPSHQTTPSIPNHTKPDVKLQTTIKMQYYCRVYYGISVAGQMETNDANKLDFTISKLEDGTLVYGGVSPLDTSHTYSLVDEGDWRVMNIVGWAEGKELGSKPAGPNYTGTKWTLTPRIHRKTGEFKAAVKSAYDAVATTYTGTCTGGE